ncbi:MAG: hypothetical protein ACXVA9_04145 [Bdellovibrionales bacterium]
MHKCWSLYNKEEKLRIDDLRIDQVRTILLAIPSKKLGEWYACREGDLHWQSLADVPDFYEDAIVSKGADVPVLSPSQPERRSSPPSATKASPPRRPLFEEGSDELETTLQVESVPTKERRTARRYVRNLTFKLAGAQKFECATADVSMSGVSLKEKLPGGTPKSFRAELSMNGTTVRILVNKVSDTTIKILEADAWDVLRNWIVNW